MDRLTPRNCHFAGEKLLNISSSTYFSLLTAEHVDGGEEAGEILCTVYTVCHTSHRCLFQAIQIIDNFKKGSGYLIICNYVYIERFGSITQ